MAIQAGNEESRNRETHGGTQGASRADEGRAKDSTASTASASRVRNDTDVEHNASDNQSMQSLTGSTDGAKGEPRDEARAQGNRGTDATSRAGQFGQSDTSARNAGGQFGQRDGSSHHDVGRFSDTASRKQSGSRWRRGVQSVRDVMTRNPKSVKSTDTVQQVAQVMVDQDTGIVPVVDNDRLLGVITDRDIVVRLVSKGVDLKTAQAREVMSEDIECVTEQDTLQDVLHLMGEHQIRRVPVVGRNDSLVGIISMADLAREADVDEQLQQAFEEISAERNFWARLR